MTESDAGESLSRYALPAPRETLDVPVEGGGTIVVRRHGETRGNRIVLSHGNGQAADFYYPYWMRFLADFEVVVFDLRNHGWNALGSLDAHNPKLFATDLDDAILPAIAHAFGEKPTLGVFHSISALVSLLAPSRGARLAGLLLFDPPICGPGKSQRQFDEHAEMAGNMVRVRRSHFASQEELMRLLALAPTLAGLDLHLKRLYAETTLRPSPDGQGFDLRCPPAYEAQAIQFMNAYAALVDYDTMACPVKVIGSDPTLPVSYLPAFDVRLVTKVDYDFLPEVGHNVPVEAAQLSYELTLEFMTKIGMRTNGAGTG